GRARRCRSRSWPTAASPFLVLRPHDHAAGAPMTTLAARVCRKLSPHLAQRLVLALLVTITLVLVAGPLGVLIHTSLLPPRTLPFSEWTVSFANYIAAFGSPDTYYLVRNTLWYAGGSVAL